MRKIVRWAVGLLAALVIVWLGVGGLAWSRNQAPALNLPPRAALPADNVYEDYLQCVREVRKASETAQALASKEADPGKRQEILTENAALLEKLSALSQKPSMVTELEPGPNFVAAIDFPNVTRLLALASQERSAQNPSRSLTPLIDGFAFCEGVQKGGATLQLIASHMSYAPLFEAFPSVLSKLPADECRIGAERVKALIESQGRLSEILQNERRVRLRQLISTFTPSANQVFRLKIPTDGYGWSYLMRPKAPAVSSLNAYFERWVAEGDKPLGEIAPPPAPTGLEGILADNSIMPDAVGVYVLRYHYKNARLRLAYTALRLEQHRKTTGQYPDSMTALGNDPLLIDPFSSQPFIYRKAGSGYTLYSIGLNRKDDGGKSYREGQMNADRPGDLLLQATF